MRGSLTVVAEVLEESGRALDGDTIRLTDSGIWLATPLGVLARAVPLAERLDLFPSVGAGPNILDAGVGDGRLLLALAILLPHRPDIRLYGL